MSRLDALPEHVCLAIGHSAQASHIEADPSLCPEFSDTGRSDIVRALRILALIDGKEAVLVPPTPTPSMVRDAMNATWIGGDTEMIAAQYEAMLAAAPSELLK